MTKYVSNYEFDSSRTLGPSKQARREKAERIKTLGEPIELPGKALAIEIHDGSAWIGENTTVVRKLDLEVRCALLKFFWGCVHFLTRKFQSGKTLGLLRGHTAPVTSIAFCNTNQSSEHKTILISGSWDKVIRQRL